MPLTILASWTSCLSYEYPCTSVCACLLVCVRLSYHEEAGLVDLGVLGDDALQQRLHHLQPQGTQGSRGVSEHTLVKEKCPLWSIYRASSSNDSKEM